MKDLKHTLTFIGLLIMLYGIIVPLVIWSLSRLMPNQADGSSISKDGHIIGSENIERKLLK